MIRVFWKSVFSLIFPSFCAACGRAGRLDQPPVCGNCVEVIGWIRPPVCRACGKPAGPAAEACLECEGKNRHYDAVFAMAAYDGVMKELLHRYKFNGMKILANFFAEQLDIFLKKTNGGKWDSVLAVPLTKEKERARGFNQSRLVTTRLAKKTGLPDLSDVLARERSPHNQHRLGKKERRQNVRGSFAIRKPALVREKRLLLVDDVFTTGETASECARILKEAGAKRVEVVALARGI